MQIWQKIIESWTFFLLLEISYQVISWQKTPRVHIILSICCLFTAIYHMAQSHELQVWLWSPASCLWVAIGGFGMRADPLGGIHCLLFFHSKRYPYFYSLIILKKLLMAMIVDKYQSHNYKKKKMVDIKVKGFLPTFIRNADHH